MNRELQKKYDDLKAYITSLGSVAVAFSSGVDSTFLLYAAREALGEKAIAITVYSSWISERELNEAKDYTLDLGVRHFIVQADAAEIEGFAQNPKNRCYLCKRALFEKMLITAKENGAMEVVEGSNVDDDGDYRPGLLAIKELDIKSPLRKVGFTKNEIREASRELQIPTWKKPSFACLASRFPYGELITNEKLRMVERGEQLLLDLGFQQFRVRIHGEVARIEIEPKDFEHLMKEDVRNEVYKKFQEYGFAYVAMDLKGYRTGSMNETIL